MLHHVPNHVAIARRLLLLSISAVVAGLAKDLEGWGSSSSSLCHTPVTDALRGGRPEPAVSLLLALSVTRPQPWP